MQETPPLMIDKACFERGCACYDDRTTTEKPVEVREVPTVLLLVKDQYGNKVLHPHNSTAQLFASIAGTKTLTLPTIKHIMALGYSIEYVHGEIPL
jgi:hypothetical protein